jgi:hypothetical protein
MGLMSEEQFDDFVKRVGSQYRQPPATPRDEIWARIEAARRASAPKTPKPVIDLASRRPLPKWGLGLLAAAAVLAVGIGIGRFVTPAAINPNPPILTAVDSGVAVESPAFRFATVATLSQMRTLLTEYDADRINDDFRASARDLLSTTRLLLSSPRLTDLAMRQLLEDLELMLVQVARLNRTGQGDERGFIDDGMAERAIRQRLGDAIPAGPAA